MKNCLVFVATVGKNMWILKEQYHCEGKMNLDHVAHVIGGRGNGAKSKS